MAERVKVTRRYDSPLRREQAARTRRQILATAKELFERDGYGATSMAAIASAAGVSLKTVYLVFDTKSGLLRALWHLLLRGEEEDVPVGEQHWYREVLDEPDPERQLRLNARNSLVVKTRAGAILEVIRDAASSDPEIAGLWARIQTEFHANQREIVQSIADKQALAPGLDVAAATDILWALNHPTLYSLLARERHWSTKRYEGWLADLFCAQLLRNTRSGGRTQ
ncbi:MAG TPA: helix-turn-helix domain-containing protein [Solirubrobacteraceae bacterium]|nr:helix-turn-helix domain-containing protein [Solirubrobacteraceae bacterium]